MANATGDIAIRGEEQPTRVLRLAVVGAGAHPQSRARQYLATVARLPDRFQLAAICDASAEVARDTAASFGANAWYTDVEHMLADERPEVVLCLVPTDGQAPAALAAVEYGAHLMTEIPYGITLDVGDAIAAACARRGSRWEVGEQVWQWPREQLKREIVRTKLLGTLTHARLWYTAGSYHGFNAVRMLLGASGGSDRLGADASRVLGHTWEVPTAPYTTYGGDQMISARAESAVIEFAGGVCCLYEKAPRPYGRFYPLRWEIEGTQGALMGEQLVFFRPEGEERYEIRDVHEDAEGERLLTEVRVDTHPPVVWHNPFRRHGIGRPDDIAKATLLCGLHRAVVEATNPLYGPEQARRDLELAFALFESARRGKWVDLPLREPTPLEARIRALHRDRYGDDAVEGYRNLLHAAFGRAGVWWEAAQWL